MSRFVKREVRLIDQGPTGEIADWRYRVQVRTTYFGRLTLGWKNGRGTDNLDDAKHYYGVAKVAAGSLTNTVLYHEVVQ